MAVQLALYNIGMVFQSPDTETRAIENVSFEIHTGEFVSIVGPSGCGKSTLLDIICGLRTPTQGRLQVNASTGYMLQKDYLLEWRTILGNCMLGPEIQHKNMRESREFVEYLLDTYGLKDFAYHYPHQLSGGMRQRAALIRTLAVQPDLMLLDEPFSALDYQTRLTVADEVWNILHRENKTALLVTHDISEAISMSDRVIVLSSRPAVIKKSYDIQLQMNTSPLEKRRDEGFRHYFNAIWKELDINAEPT